MSYDSNGRLRPGTSRGQLAAFFLLLVGSFLAGCGANSPAVQEPEESSVQADAPAPLDSARFDSAESVTREDVSTDSSVLIEDQRSDHQRTLIPVSDADPIWGDFNAPVTIVEFADLECPYCAKVQATIAALQEKYGPQKLRLVWKHNPLPFHKQAQSAHEAAAAVYELAGAHAFWVFVGLAFENRTQLNENNYVKWALRAGVTHERAFRNALTRRNVSDRVQGDVALAKKLGITGVPNFRINGRKISGAQAQDEFEAIIDEQLKEAQKLLEVGTRPSEIYPILVAKFGDVEPDEKPKPAPQDTTVWSIPVFEDDPRRGGSQPLVTIVEFAEFQCPFCKRVQPTVDRILSEYGDDVQLVWKDNPLGFHTHAEPAAQAARAVYKAQGDVAFWRMHDRLFESQPKLEENYLLEAARGLGVSEWKLRAAMEKHSFSEKLEQSQELAMDYQARGTPHFFVNGYRIKGAQPYETFKTTVEEQLEKARAMVREGTPREKIYEKIMKTGKTPPPPEKRVVEGLPKDAPVKGAKNAPVVIQVFSDFQCPFCARVLPTLDQVMKQHGRQVRLEWHNLPLPFHKEAPLAAEAAHEVFVQKGSAAFWKYHDLLFSGQKTPGLSRTELENYARKIAGLNMAAFKRALDNRTHQSRIEADLNVAKKAKINGTPSFLVNGFFISGAQPYGSFNKAIRLSLAELKGK